MISCFSRDTDQNCSLSGLLRSELNQTDFNCSLLDG